MKIDQQQLEERQVKLTVEVEPEKVNEARQRAARKLAKETKIPGFRPGKAPYHMVERYVGEAAIMEEAVELLVNEVYPKAIEESGVHPYGPGSLENIPSQDPMVFEFVIPLEAEVTLGDYKSIRIPYEYTQVDEAQVDQTIENFREQQAVIEPVERPAQTGDEVTIRLKADRKNAEEGEVTTFIRERSVPIVVRSEEEDNSEEWPFPGFSRNLVGLNVDDHQVITYKFPEDSAFEMLRGTEVEYEFTVEGVKSRTLPPVDDELAKMMGEYNNLEALRKDILERLENQAKQSYDEEYESKVMDELVNEAQVSYPPQMVHDEIDGLIRQLENRLSYQGMEMETYLKSRNMDMEALHEELKPVAETRLKKFLSVMKVAEVEKVIADPEAVQQETIKTLEAYTSSMSPEQVRKGISSDLLNALISNVTSDMLIRKTMEKLRAVAKGENVETEIGEPAPIETDAPSEAKQAAAEVAAEAGPAEEAVPPEAEAMPAAEPKPRKRKKAAKEDKAE